MINQLLLIIFVICVYEFIKYIKFRDKLKLNLEIYYKLLKLFRLKNASDFRKEKLIFYYSKSLFKISITILFILILMFIFMAILDLFSSSFFSFTTSLFGIIEFGIVFIIYYQIRKKFNAKL